MIVLGIDTAIRCTGYGVIEMRSVNDTRILDCGIIKNSRKLLHSECLRRLAGGIGELIKTYTPEHLAIEDVFYSKNIKTAMILSLARGAVITTAAIENIPIYQYSPKTAKRAVVGSGNASKEQVATMVSSMLNISFDQIQLDSTDALSIALCHGQLIMRSELGGMLTKQI